MPSIDLSPLQDPDTARRHAYTDEVPITDQLDTMRKAIAALFNGDPMPTEMQDLLDAVVDIKARIPTE